MADINLTATTVASSRIRLARNLNGYPFPSRLKDDKQAKEIIRSVTSAINKVDEFRLYYMDGVSCEQAQNMVENHLISPLLTQNPSRSAVLINAKKNISIMINEEDHLREQCIERGYSLRKAYQIMSSKDEIMARSIKFAYDEQLGYLTACPTNLGTGLRASVMLFLPALTMNGIMPKVIEAAERLGLTVRGAYGEGTSAVGYMYQVSNEVTLGVDEEQILFQVEAFADKISQMELYERERLKKGINALAIKDKCLRSLGILTNCALMQSEEFESLCSNLKLGVCLGYVAMSDIFAIDDLIVAMKPSNLNALCGRQLTAAERDVYRANYVSDKIKKLIIK